MIFWPTRSRRGGSCALRRQSRMSRIWKGRLKAWLAISAVLFVAAAPPAQAQTNFDRPGGDYRNFGRKGDEGDEACKAACDGDNKCRAWTYARPGYVGRAAHCFLKKEIKPPRRKAGFISGVVR